MDDVSTRERLTDDDINTVISGSSVPRAQDADTDGVDTKDADGTDGDAKDGKDGDAKDTDGTDSKDTDGTDSPS